MSAFRITVLSSLTASLVFYLIELVLDTTVWELKEQYKQTKLIRKLVWWLSLPIKWVWYTIRFGLSYWIDRLNKYKYILKVYHNDKTDKRMREFQSKYTEWIIKESSWFDTEYECKNRAMQYLNIHHIFSKHREGNAIFYSVFLSDKNFKDKIAKHSNTISVSFISWSN